MKKIQDKLGGRPAKKRTDKQKKVVSTKLTELQYYAIRKRAGEAGLRISEYVRQAVVSAEAGGFALVAVELLKLKDRIVEIINHLSDDWKNKKGKRF